MSGDDIVGHSDYYHSQEFANRRNLYDDIHRRTYESGVYVDEFSTPLGETDPKIKVAAAIAELDRLPKCLRRTAQGKIVIKEDTNGHN